MLLLAVDTATAACAVALAEDDRVLAEYNLLGPRAHSAQLMPLIARCFTSSGRDRRELNAVACGVGPGSFTGLRIGLAAIKAMAYALKIPAVGVGTLDAIAAGAAAAAPPGAVLVPMLDAKRGEVYAATYTAEGTPLAPPRVVGLTALCQELQGGGGPVLALGDGALALKPQVLAALGPQVRFATPDLALPRGSAVARLARQRLAAGAAGDPYSLAPLYLRRSEAEEVWQRRQQEGG